MSWDTLTWLQKADVVLVHLMVLGQLVFVIMWATLPWWRQWVGRALMIKSAALLLLLAWALAEVYIYLSIGPHPWMDDIAIGTHFLVLVGIWSQVVAIGHEMLIARQAARGVTGTRRASEVTDAAIERRRADDTATPEHRGIVDSPQLLEGERHG